VTEKAQTLAQRVQEQTDTLVQQVQEQILKQQAMKGAQDFYETSLGLLKSRLENDRSQLQNLLLRQLPDLQQEVWNQIEALVASYKVIENSLDETAQQQLGVHKAVDQAQKRLGGVGQKAQNLAGQDTERTWKTAEGVPHSQEAKISEEEIRIPLIEEELVVEKRPVVKEEIRVRKKIVEEEELIEEDVRREEIDIDDQTKRRDR
jgi:stress response protein YsnF